MIIQIHNKHIADKILTMIIANADQINVPIVVSQYSDYVFEINKDNEITASDVLPVLNSLGKEIREAKS